jgi:hypothetical protein
MNKNCHSHILRSLIIFEPNILERNHFLMTTHSEMCIMCKLDVHVMGQCTCVIVVMWKIFLSYSLKQQFSEMEPWNMPIFCCRVKNLPQKHHQNFPIFVATVISREPSFTILNYTCLHSKLVDHASWANDESVETWGHNTIFSAF